MWLCLCLLWRSSVGLTVPASRVNTSRKFEWNATSTTTRYSSRIGAGMTLPLGRKASKIGFGMRQTHRPQLYSFRIGAGQTALLGRITVEIGHGERQTHLPQLLLQDRGWPDSSTWQNCPQDWTRREAASTAASQTQIQSSVRGQIEHHQLCVEPR